MARVLHAAGVLELDQLTKALQEVRRQRAIDPEVSLARLLVEQGLVYEAELRLHLSTGQSAQGSSLTLASGPRLAWAVGERVGDFELEEPLGRGGMGVVFRARHLESGARVALKGVELQDDPKRAERFSREAAVMANVDAHPNVARVYAAGQLEGCGYLALELLDGGDLSDRLRAGQPLEPRVAARIVAQLGRGLAHVHASGILHRDLKPGNVLFDASNSPKLVDFGLALIQGAESLTVTGELLGTPSYMAPEQAIGLKQLDVRTDVYGLGAILYACLTGRPPFEGILTDVLAQVLSDPPPSPRSLRPELDPELEGICLRALAKDPDERFPDATSLAAALEAWAAGPRRLAAQPPASSRRARGYLLGAMVAVVAVAGGIAAWAGRDAGEAEPPPTVSEPVDLAELQRRLERAQATLADDPARAAEELAQLASELGASGEQGELAARAEAAAREAVFAAHSGPLGALKLGAQGVRGCAISPRGDRLVSASYSGVVALWTFPGLELVRVLDLEARGRARAVAFSPHGERVAVARDASVEVWESTTGRYVRTYAGHAADVRGCAFSPDGTRLASWGDDATVRIESLEVEGVRVLKGHRRAVLGCSFLGEGQLLSVSRDGSARVWDLTRDEPPRLLRELGGPQLRGCAVSPNGQRVAIVGDDGLAEVWAREGWSLTFTLPVDPAALTTCAFVGDDLLMLGGKVGGVEVWDLRSPTSALRAWAAHDEAELNSSQVSPLGDVLVTAADDGWLRLWPLRALALVGFAEDPSAAVASALNAEPAGSTPADAALLDGLDALASGEHERAREDLSRAVELEPERVEGRLGLALALARLGSLEFAATEAGRAAELAPDAAEPRLLLGRLGIQGRDYRGAEELLTRALALEPERAGAHFHRAEARLGLRDTQGALDDLGRAIELDPGSDRYLVLRARVYQSRVRDYRAAIADFTRALALSPREATLYGQRSNCFLELREFARAEADCTQAVKLDPDYASAFADRGLVRLFMQPPKLAAARSDFDRALELEPDHGNARFYRAQLRAREGDVAGARTDYEHARRVLPSSRHAEIDAALRRLP